VQVAFAFQIEIKRAVLGHQRQHVIEESNASGNGRFSRAVDIQRQRNFGLRRFTFDARLPLLHARKLNSVGGEDKL
jgi:hypothetical protein